MACRICRKPDHNARTCRARCAPRKRRNPNVVCQNCGKGNRSAKDTCWSCGFDLGATPGERLSRIKRRAETRIPLYRRNVGFPMRGRKVQKRSLLRSVEETEYDTTFHRLYYGGQLNDSWLYLLVSLGFAPAVDIIEESQGKRAARSLTRGWYGSTDSLERVNFAELDAKFPEFSNYFTLKCVTTLLGLIAPKIDRLGAMGDATAWDLVSYINSYMREYEFYPDHCHRVIENIAIRKEMMHQSIEDLSGLRGTFLGERLLPTTGGRDLLRFVQALLDYLNKMCGPCPNPDCPSQYHGSENVSFNQSLEYFRHEILSTTYDVAYGYKVHTQWRRFLIALIFDAFRTIPSYGKLSRAPIVDDVEERRQESRFTI